MDAGLSWDELRRISRLVTELTSADASAHHNAANIRLIVIKGPSLMTLIHALYERAADEA